MTTPRYAGPSKMATISVSIFLVSCGLCGAGFFFQPDAYVTYEGLLGLAGLIIGALGILASIIFAFIVFLDKPKDDPQ